jgi:uncharacterized protein involved in exopolysaccharide biosynthesis
MGAAAWRGRLIFLEVIAACVLIALIFIHLQRPQYTAITVIAQQEAGQSNPLNNSSALKALSSLTGNEVGMQSEIDEFLNLLTTPSVSGRLIERLPVMEHIFHSEFDPEKKQWKRPQGLLSGVKGVVYPALGIPPKPSLSEFDLAAYISRHVNVSKDRATSLVSVSFSDPDPAFAVRFLSTLFNVADEQMRDAIKIRAGNNVKSLGRIISTLDNADLKLSLITIFQTQEQRYMLASSGDTYAFRYVQPPATSGQQTWPAVWAILGVAIITGAAISFLLSLLIYLIVQAPPNHGFVSRVRKAGSVLLALFVARPPVHV